MSPQPGMAEISEEKRYHSSWEEVDEEANIVAGLLSIYIPTRRLRQAPSLLSDVTYG